jgi:hypothetical protein
VTKNIVLETGTDPGDKKISERELRQLRRLLK